MAVRVAAIEAYGGVNGLLATKNILKGEHIFSETPFVWSRTDPSEGGAEGNAVTLTCAECGRFNRVNQDKGEGKEPTSVEFLCVPCGTKYCSELCRASAFSNHHSVLCGGGGGSRSTSSSSCCPSAAALFGHQACAAKLLAKIAIDLVATSASSSALGSSSEEVAASRARVLGQFYSPPFTQAIHAFRGGRSMPDSLFESTFRSCYFDGHLREGYEFMRTHVFPVDRFGSTFQDICLSENQYDRLMGLFLCNNVCVRIEKEGVVLEGTALYELYSKTNHACISDWENKPLTASVKSMSASASAGTGTGISSSPTSRDEALVGERTAKAGGNPEKTAEKAANGGNDNEGRNDDDDENENENGIYERVGMSVFAARDLPEGQQVFTCYLAAGTGAHAAKRQRAAELAQYLFVCSCTLCVEQQEGSGGDGPSDY